ncbi:MAG: hypothetical protein IJZ32_02490 [Clostridia bacterium]|nr:hypothetical protein [Clostridia bacterium]
MMKKNVWKAMIAALCLAMTMAFAACGSDTASGFDSPSSESSSSSSSAPADETPEDETPADDGGEDGGEEDGGDENPTPNPNPAPQKWTKNY